MNFTKEQFDALYDARIHFESIIKYNTIKNCPRWLVEKVADIFDEAKNGKVHRNWNCNTCVFNFMGMVGKLYFEDENIYLNEDNVKKDDVQNEEVFTDGEQTENTEQIKEEDVKVEVKKSRGRPKKK